MAQDVSSNISGNQSGSQSGDLASKAGHSPDSGAPVSTPISMKQELSQFIAARKELASIEAKEAAEFTVKKIIFGVVLAGSLFFAWSLILAAVTGALAPLAGRTIADRYDWLPGWVAVLFILGILHVIAAIISVALLKKKPSSPLFGLSLLEIQKDKQWLKKSN